VSRIALSMTAVCVIACGFASAAPADAEPPGNTATPANLQKLYGLVSNGFGPDNCQTPEEQLADNQLAALDCEVNQETDVLFSATYVLYGDVTALRSGFSDAIAQYDLVTCPGLAPSPTKWHYDDSPDQSAGSLACGTRGGFSEMAWTDDTELMLATAQSFDDVPPLYQWWKTGS
jgi:hypothetical protein